MIRLFVGNTAPSVTGTIEEVKSNGSLGPLDLTGVASVHFQMRSLFGSALLIDSNVVIVSALGGEVRYDWTLADTTTTINNSPGPYRAWWHLDYGGGVVLDTPEFDVQFWSHAPRRDVGPCTDWCSSQDVVGCFTDVEPDTCLESATRMASEVLYELSGRQFPGWCQSVIRPCSTLGCGMQVLSRGHLVNWDGDAWRGETDPCSCGYLSTILLPGIAQYVVEVLIDGVILAPDSYRIDPDNQLIRTDGGAWPACQNMAADGDAPGAFQVTYGHGYDPPETGRRAAAQLAHEFWLACNGEACALPSGVVEIVRQGIKITRAASLFREGATGLAMVDSFLSAFHRCEPTYVFSPDTYPTSRRTA